MENKSEETYDTWKYHRRLQFINFCFGSYVVGTELTIYMQTEFFYFKDVMKTEDPGFYYGFSRACLCTSGAICSTLVSYYGDRTNKIREMSIALSVLSIIGNILYLLYYSPYIILFGQFLSGTIAARNVVIQSELSRVFSRTEISRKIAITILFASLGGFSGPALTFAFKHVHIEFGDWQLMIGNMPGLYVCFLSTIELFLDYFILKNVSKEFDALLPEERLKTGLDKHLDNVTTIKEYMAKIKCLLSKKSLRALYVITFIVFYTRGTILLIQPAKFLEYIRWTQMDLATFYIIIIAAGAVPFSIAVTVIIKYVEDYFLLLTSLCALILSAVVMIILSHYHDTLWISYTLAYGHGIIFCLNQVPFHVAVRAMLVKFVPDNMRTIADAFRHTLMEMGYMLGGITLKFHQLYFTYSLTFLVIIIVFCLFWVLIESDQYRNIRTISTENKGEEKEELLSKCNE